MAKYHKLISFGLGLLFFATLQGFTAPQPIFRFLLPAFLLYAGLATWYNFRYLKSIERYNIWLLARPLLLFFASFGLFVLIPSPALRGLFLLAAVGVIFLVENFLDALAENILLLETLLIAFGLFMACFAAYFYLPELEPVFLLGVFVSSGLLARSFYEWVPRPARVKTAGSLAIGLFCSELYWALNFLHFHYSVQALVLFNVFFLCLILNYFYLFHLLNFKKVGFYLFLVAACDLLVLLATPWRIVAH